jgi:hypothetical protein
MEPAIFVTANTNTNGIVKVRSLVDEPIRLLTAANLSLRVNSKYRVLGVWPPKDRLHSSGVTNLLQPFLSPTLPYIPGGGD